MGYPVLVRRRDRTLANYPGSGPEFVAHSWLREMIETTLAGELSALPSAIIVSVGSVNRAIAHLQELRAVCVVLAPSWADDRGYRPSADHDPRWR